MTQEQVAAIINAPIPLTTDTYTPITHKDVIVNINRTLEGCGIKPIESYITSSNNHQLMNGKFVFDEGSDGDVQMALDFRNSYNKRYAAEVRATTNVKICSNGLMIPLHEVSFKRKHTGSNAVSDFDERVKQAIDYMPTVYAQALTVKERTGNVDMTPDQMYELAGWLYGQGIMTTPMFSETIREIDNPTFGKFGYNNNDSLWDMYNHCTLAMKKSTPDKVYERHDQLTSLISDRYALELV